MDGFVFMLAAGRMLDFQRIASLLTLPPKNYRTLAEPDLETVRL